jgi:hypothetical protein
MSVSRTLKRNILRNQIVTDEKHSKFGKKMGNKLMGRVWKHYLKELGGIEEKYQTKLRQAIKVKSQDKALQAVAAAEAFKTGSIKQLEQKIFKGKI